MNEKRPSDCQHSRLQNPENVKPRSITHWFLLSSLKNYDKTGAIYATNILGNAEPRFDAQRGVTAAETRFHNHQKLKYFGATVKSTALDFNRNVTWAVSPKKLYGFEGWGSDDLYGGSEPMELEPTQS